AKPVAIAASTALPPARRTESPTALAMALAETTIVCGATTGTVGRGGAVGCWAGSAAASVATTRRMDENRMAETLLVGNAPHQSADVYLSAAWLTTISAPSP